MSITTGFKAEFIRVREERFAWAATGKTPLHRAIHKAAMHDLLREPSDQREAVPVKPNPFLKVPKQYWDVWELGHKITLKDCKSGTIVVMPY